MKAISAKIDQDLINIAESWKKTASEIDAAIKVEVEILQSDAAKTDRSENAVYQIAVDNYANLQVQKMEIASKIEAFERYNVDYVECEYVTIGSTVSLLQTSTNKQFYIKIVPADLGAAIIGAVSEASAVGKAIKGRRPGDVFTVKTRKGILEYKILDLL